MNRRAALLGVLLHIFGALIAPGLHLHEHAGGGDSFRHARAYGGDEGCPNAPCCCAHEARMGPTDHQRDRLSAPGHDERECAICALAYRVLDTPPVAVLVPQATTWEAPAPAVWEPIYRDAGREFVPTRGPPKQLS